VPVTDPSRPAPPAADPAALRLLAVRVARDAAEFLRGLPRPWDTGPAAGSVGTKSSPTDVVTASDTAVEALIRSLLAELAPGDAIVGEEHGGAEGADPDRVVWVLDPIDGTVNFLYGLPWYAVSVAATRGGVSLAGAVVEPVSGRVWSAAAGQGATCDGRPLAGSDATDVALALVGTGFAYDARRRGRQAAFVAELVPRVRDVRRTGSAALDMCAVAAGWTDAYLEHGCHWWDWAAAALIAQEAGATVRVPGVAGLPDPADGLGADAILVAAPGIASELADLAREHGAAHV
jgi:myo-inositol-1(or 4)-monophosphatase